MPVPPTSPSVGRYSSYSSYSSYRSPSSSSYLGRTTSLDRSSYSSSYGTGYTSSYSSKYARPPLPSYSASTDTYRSSRSLRQSPARPAYSRLASDSHIETTSYTSRFANLDSKRDTSSSSRDSGYGSRLTSRDRSVDLVNGNGVDTSHFGPSHSSYACNYRWESREKDKLLDGKDAENGEDEKVRISDRIRAFETRSSARERLGLPAGRESALTSLRDTGLSSSRDSILSRDSGITSKDSGLSSRDSGLSSGLETSLARRRAARTSDAATRITSARRSSPEGLSRDAADENANTSNERRPSVTELCRKYDTNHNVTNGVSRQEDDEDGSDGGSVCSGATLEEAGPARSTRKAAEVSTRTDSPITARVDSPAGARVDSPNRLRVDSPARNHVESPSRNRLDSPTLKESPSRAQRDSPLRNRLDSSVTRQESDRDGRSSPVLNGTIDKPKYRVEVDGTETPGYRSRYRRDRVRERIAARLAKEAEDDGSPPRRQASTISSGSGTGGVLSENNGLVGLRNIGNTCFMNSVTQCLSNTRCLLEYLVRDGYSSDVNTTISTMKGDLIRAFACLLSDMWNEGADNSRALNTGPFKAQLQRFAPVFSGYQQHDAQEFLRKLLEGLHEDVNRVAAKPKPITEDIDDDLDDNQKAMESWKRYLRYDDSKIVDMFVGQLKSSLQCSVCGHCSVTFDPFWDLSLPIPSKSGQVRMSQCMDLFTKEEVLDGDERPTCSKCKERRKMTKSFSIQKFPKVLVLHLKRFSPLERWRGKLSCTVEFPLEGLNLSKYASNSSSSPSYNLIGVANHSGTTYSGHYTAYCKHPYSGTWHEYNDSRVSNISQGRICSPEAYVLFYEISSSSSKL